MNRLIFMNSQIPFDILPVLCVHLMPFFSSFSLCSLCSYIHFCTCRLEPANDNSVILLLSEHSVAVLMLLLRWSGLNYGLILYLVIKVILGHPNTSRQTGPIYFLIQSHKLLIYLSTITARTQLNVSFVKLRWRHGDWRCMLILGVNNDHLKTDVNTGLH